MAAGRNGSRRGGAAGSKRRWCAALLACQLAATPGACARTPNAGTGRGAADGNAPAVEMTAAVPGAVDLDCLRRLDSQSVPYQRVEAAGGMRTPIEVSGPLGRLTLVPRGRRGAVMDCMLASALLQAGGVFEELGISALAFSAAFDQRTRRGSTEMSAHAYGLAIDVHTIRGSFGEYDVRKDFEAGVGLWRGLGKDVGALVACVGKPATTEGRVLRRLACGLKLHPAFRVIVTPDDNADHQDHLHLEARSSFFPPPATAPPLAPTPAPPPPPPRPSPDTTVASAPASPRSIAERKSARKRKPPARKAKKKLENAKKLKNAKTKSVNAKSVKTKSVKTKSVKTKRVNTKKVRPPWPSLPTPDPVGRKELQPA